MLIGIPEIIPPELMKVMMEMGHGDELVLADGNFPAASNARRLIRCDGQGTLALLKAILRFFPLEYRREAAVFMRIPPELNFTSVLQAEYLKVLRSAADKELPVKYEERDDFYARAGAAYAIVATSERERFANVIIRKGVVGL